MLRKMKDCNILSNIIDFDICIMAKEWFLILVILDPAVVCLGTISQAMNANLQIVLLLNSGLSVLDRRKAALLNATSG